MENMKTLNLENLEKYGINMTPNAPTNRFTLNNIPGVLLGITVLTVCLQSLCTVKWSRSLFSLPSLQVWCFARISDLWQGRKPDIEGWKIFYFCLSWLIKFLATSRTVLLSYPFMISFDFGEMGESQKEAAGGGGKGGKGGGCGRGKAFLAILFSIFFPYRFPYVFHICSIFVPYFRESGPPRKIWKIWKIWNLGICRKIWKMRKPIWKPIWKTIWNSFRWPC